MATTESNIDTQYLVVPAGTIVAPVDDFVVPSGVKPPRKSAFGVFREMPIVVKLGVFWLFLIFFGAIYAQLDVRVFNGSLPLADPNLQLNNFNPATGEFGTSEVNENPSWAHLLGTDALARDTFSRAVHGAYVSVAVAVVSVTCGVVIGGILGALGSVIAFFLSYPLGWSVSATIIVVLGSFFLLAYIFSPKYGLFSKRQGVA